MGTVIFWIIFWIVIAVLAFCPLYFIFLFIVGLFVDMNKEYEHDSKFFRFLLTNSTAVAAKLIRIRVKVTGRELLPKDTRYLLVCNHRSKFDPILTWYAFGKEQLSFISKPENFKVPVYGRIIHRCLFMAIDRENPRNAMKTVNRAADLLKRGEVNVAVYPEGRRNYDEGLLPFHGAMFKIAQKANVPIVVMTAKGTYEIQKNFPLHRSHVELDVLGVLSAEEIKGMKTTAIGERVAGIMNKNL
ncbi:MULTISPECIES: lysophospholipid acyltransferase family protein [Ruminococcus]|jgi:1-acyl-sn-glycerol-3-phosphate acyltransferase|uniref:1-acyl-sn-glycerol-3-phosphate acyltransferase n=1 Tax=Ruminococcus difficilis TaxID=2763069 RepID=A0A934TZQ7_9FIRM|nr:lysophospholipid acyltransferase family protein [Ruminococcus difficilis]MBQ1353788.1 1-acyl-sn-glycerol-3-phosphate acyltransferase [Ruminococcus sp.]MDO4892509.1 lysophospholipid acyltransferase family protein [Eubacteriales bacterium]MBK6088601.1 1-acyl-sn-glycerol-3-phosphate acyltransferase [Ruminococcus difficilis]MBQ1829539.1 1-acyl-sn-glycerol-3-phosphate acyltransferase [Ruminococcus sp.]MBQ2442547.1 1-acyl-sn-glycerol-3-phosphate acyltransferase [Ruminococcus sp.]